MILFKNAGELTKYLKTKSDAGISIGFVPTMGALHAGHLELLRVCRQQSSLSVASIFVNPTQFNDPADLAKYPITTETDILQLEQAGCDVLFLPPVQEVYPNGTAHLPSFDLGPLEMIWEGKYRPGHFQGVCQVMDRLLQVVMPDRLFMGQKDYQQCMVIRRLIELRQWDIKLIMVPTVREASGLAMSSRNTRLNEEEREKATAIFRSMTDLKTRIVPGKLSFLTDSMQEQLLAAGFEKLDYAAIADARTLEPVTDWDGVQPLVTLVAAFIGGVRLIDNMPVT